MILEIARTADVAEHRIRLRLAHVDTQALGDGLDIGDGQGGKLRAAEGPGMSTSQDYPDYRPYLRRGGRPKEPRH